MSRYFTKSFTKFLIGFLAIVIVAFAILILSAKYVSAPAPVDNVAVPQ